MSSLLPPAASSAENREGRRGGTGPFAASTGPSGACRAEAGAFRSAMSTGLIGLTPQEEALLVQLREAEQQLVVPLFGPFPASHDDETAKAQAEADVRGELVVNAAWFLSLT